MTYRALLRLILVALLVPAACACSSVSPQLAASTAPLRTTAPSPPLPTQPLPTATAPPTATEERRPAATAPSTAAPSTVASALPASGAPSTAAPTTTALPTPLRPGPSTLDSLGDPYYPLLGNGGYHVRHYMIDLRADVAKNVITSTVTLDALATQPLPAFNLDFVGFTLTRVTVQDAPARTARTAHELTITPARPLRQGESFTATVAYTGVPNPHIAQAIPISAGWNHYPTGIYVASEPDGAASWFPVNDHPRDKATYTFRVTVPKPYVVAANGLLRSTHDQGTTTTYVWETQHPLASYLATVDIGTFVTQTSSGPGGLPIQNFFPPTLAPQATQVFSRTAAMIQFFSTVFGPYPFEAYGAIVPDTSLGFALETQTRSVFGRDLVERSFARRDDQVVAHELAHQWFGDSVSVQTWADIWLNEGFATFAQWLWLEHTQGPAAFTAAVRNNYAASAQQHWPAPGAPPPGDLFNAGVYGRGGLTLAALRLRLGDEVFFRILRTYAARYRYGNAGTGDFIALAQSVSQRDLQDFFAGWLYAPQMPAIPELGLAASP